MNNRKHGMSFAECSVSIFAVVVMRNRAVEQSRTIQGLIELNRREVIFMVVDNSEPLISDNSKYCTQVGIPYVATGENMGTSRAYNIALECYYDSFDANSIMVLLDDDTALSDDYFDALLLAASAHPEIDVFAPIVFGQDGVIYSPNSSRFLKNRLVSSPDEIVAQRRFNAIASCLAIRHGVFDDFRFNEALFVDQVDQLFFDEMRLKGKRFMKLDVVVRQDFHQRDEHLNPYHGWNRLQIRIRDIFMYSCLLGGREYLFLAFLKSCGLGIQMAVKTKSPVIVCRAVALSVERVIGAWNH